ncbi:hypothetical protein Y886_28865 [Xanthomonas hyacinthi DSM 19077]|nr:hypothetical protein Y886_28865 [Xanthomonas hyacinthi DSM 19077]
MLRMPKRAASAGCASLSSLPRRMRGSNCAAAASNCGAMVRHGPHHGAQKSTSSGMSLGSAQAAKVSAFNASGAPTNSARWLRDMRILFY